MILVIQDSFDIAETYYVRVLQQAGYQVERIDSMEDLKRKAPKADLVIVPETRNIVIGGTFQDVLAVVEAKPFLVLTGSPHVPLSISYLGKPFERNQLLERVSRLLKVKEQAYA